MVERTPLKTDAQVRRALSQRARNQRAAGEGRALPFPNVWDAADPTKVVAPASDEMMQASYAAFRTLCRPRPRRQHLLRTAPSDAVKATVATIAATRGFTVR